MKDSRGTLKKETIGREQFYPLRIISQNNLIGEAINLKKMKEEENLLLPSEREEQPYQTCQLNQHD